MKAIQMGLLWIWVFGFLLIGLSLYSTTKLPSIQNHLLIKNHHRKGFGFGFGEWVVPKTGISITIFTAPRPGYSAMAVRSWLGLSPDVNVVLFGTDPSLFSFAAHFGSRVSVEPRIDFTFLGTPFFHSMVARARASTSDISVLIDPETILLPDFISTLHYAQKLDHDWLLVASSRNLSYFPFQFDESGKHWLREDGKHIRARKLQEFLAQNQHWDRCSERMLLAWNKADPPLHNGVLPPFIYGKGLHNHWLINEALSSDFRFVFDASWTISSFYLNGLSDITKRGWEHTGNSHLGTRYGTLAFRDASYSSLIKLFKCDGQYIFVDTENNIVYPFGHERSLSLWKGSIMHSRGKKKMMNCVDDMKSRDGVFDCSFKDPVKLSTRSLYLPFTLESLLRKIADESKSIVLAVAGFSYKDMLMSWACRLRRLNVKNFVICALDDEIYHFSILQGLPVFKDPLAPSNISFDECHFGTHCFQRVTKSKSRLVLQILKLGYNVLLSDVDVYWFQNPLPFLRSFGPAVLAAQSDEYNETGPINLPRRLNSGFYFAYSDSSTIAAMEKVVKHATTSNLSEQPSFYDTLCGVGGSYRVDDNRCLEPETNLTVQFLDRNHFPNGAYHGLWEKKNVKAACVKKGCLVLHNNWINGRRKKLERQVLSGLWEYDISTRMCSQSLHETKPSS